MEFIKNVLIFTLAMVAVGIISSLIAGTLAVAMEYVPFLETTFGLVIISVWLFAVLGAVYNMAHEYFCEHAKK